MLRVLQPRQATLLPMRGLLGKLRRWWMAMTNEEQRDVLVRGATVAVCAVAATVTLPVIGQVQSDIRAQADFRESAQRLEIVPLHQHAGRMSRLHHFEARGTRRWLTRLIVPSQTDARLADAHARSKS